jgi:hypothetical protein
MMVLFRRDIKEESKRRVSHDLPEKETEKVRFGTPTTSLLTENDDELDHQRRSRGLAWHVFRIPWTWMLTDENGTGL